MKNRHFSLKQNYEVKISEKPSYELDPFGLQKAVTRFDEREAAFYSARFTTEQMSGDSWRDKMSAVATRKMLQAIPGYGQLDYAFSEASWASYRPYDQSPLMNWIDQPGLRRPVEKELMAQKQFWGGTPKCNSELIRKAGHFFGAVAVGITAANHLWFYSYDREGLPLVFSDTAEHPEINAKGKIIPSRLNRVIVMLVAQDRELATFSPSPLAGVAVGLSYSRMAELASKMAALIRGLGFDAIPMGNDTSLSIPLAVDAGLGEAGRHGLLLNPDYGSLVRICKVLTDLPLETDRPITFGTASICRSCTICADSCPARAISFEQDPTFELVCPSNNEGIKRWPVNSWACLRFWVNNGKDCGICQAVCPFSRTKQVGLKCNDPAKWWQNKRQR